MRKNIFEILSEKINLEREVKRIAKLCEERTIYWGQFGYSLEEFVNYMCLSEWINRNRFLDVYEMKEELGIDNICNSSYTVELVLIYLEFLANMIWLTNRKIGLDSECFVMDLYVHLQKCVWSLIEDLGFEMKVLEDSEKVVLFEKDAAAMAVAEIIESKYAYDVIAYKHVSLKGDVVGKQRILKMLADQFEAIRQPLKRINPALESNTGYLLNKMNIRHNNLNGANEIAHIKNMEESELEEWYDETYQMILLSILEVDNIERNQKVTKLKQKLEGS